MATKLYFRSTISDFGTGNNDANLRGSAAVWTHKELSTTAGSSATSQATDTVAGTTAGVEVTSGGAFPYVFYSPPLDADITISGSVTWNIWARESNMSANVAINGRLEVIDGATGTITLIDQTARVTELQVSSTTNSLENFSETPGAGVACKRGDRLRVRIFGDDAGTMASGYTFTIGYDGPTGAADGDTWVQLTENLTFVSEPAGTTIYPTDTASAVSTASVDREAWTSRGAGVQTDVRNTAAGWTAPLQITDTAGGTVVDWFTRPLTAFTLGGAVRVNGRVSQSVASLAPTLRCEIARVASDGTSPSVWGATTWMSSATMGSETVGSFLVSGDDLSVSDGQRLRIRFYLDDGHLTAMTTGRTATLYYAGTSGGASGDTYLTFTQTLTESSSGTNAAAELASGTGAANAASISLSPSTVGLASGTGGAPNAVVITGIATNAGLATATGSALAASILLAVSAALSSGTGTANQASVSVPPTAGHATGSGTAYAAVPAVAGAPNIGTGTGNAGQPTAAVGVNTGHAAGTGAALNATVSVTTATNVNAELASGTGTAYNATVTAVGITNAAGQLASGTGTANNATVTTVGITNATAGAATGTGTALDADPTVASAPNIGTGTGTAGAPAPAVGVNGLLAAGTGTALNATVSTTSATDVDAGLASGTGTALDATVRTGITLIGSDTETGTDPASGTWTVPAGTADGDWVLIWLESTNAWTINDVSGFTEELDANAGNTHLYIAWKRYQVADGGSYGWTRATHATDSGVVWGIEVYRGVYPTGDPINASAGATTGSSADPDPSAVTPTADNSLVWALVAKMEAAGTFAAPTDYELVGSGDGVGGGGTDTSAATVIRYNRPTSSQDPGAVDLGTSSGSWSAYTIAVSPATTETSAAAGLASGTGSANDVDPAVAGAPNIATGTGNVGQVAPAVAVNALLASGTGSAHNAAASFTSTTDAAAGLASGTGTAHDVDPAIATGGGLAAGTAQANQPATALSVQPGLGSGTGTAHGATIATTSAAQAAAGLAAGTGTAHDATAATTRDATAGIGTGTGQAHNAAVLAASAPNVATGTGAANGITTAIGVHPDVAAGGALAYNAIGSGIAGDTGEAGHAAGTGVVGQVSIAIVTNALLASGAGAAYDAFGGRADTGGIPPRGSALAPPPAHVAIHPVPVGTASEQ